MTAQSKVVKIELRRGEGASIDCGKWHTLYSWEEADRLLKKWSITAPKDGGYDKCDFKISFDDDDKYQGRYDLKHWSCKQDSGLEISLAQHVKGFLEFVSGVRPSWMSDNQWKETRRMFADSEQEAKQWLETKIIPA